MQKDVYLTMYYKRYGLKNKRTQSGVLRKISRTISYEQIERRMMTYQDTLLPTRVSGGGNENTREG